MSNNLVAYEAKIKNLKTVEKEKADGDSYKLVEVTYESNGKEITKSFLHSNKKLLELCKGIKGKDKTLVFEKKGKFLNLVNILEAGESKNYQSSKSSYSGGGNYKKTQTFNSEGMERGNALHCASRIVVALINNDHLQNDELNDSSLAYRLNHIADEIQKGRHQEEKKESKKEEVDEFEEVSEDEVKESDLDEETHPDFNDDIDF